MSFGGQSSFPWTNICITKDTTVIAPLAKKAKDLKSYKR